MPTFKKPYKTILTQISLTKQAREIKLSVPIRFNDAFYKHCVAGAAAATKISQIAKIMSSPQKKILLAEDDASMRNFLSLTLKRAGFDVSTVEDGLAALEAAAANDFDAIVADDVMPNMTGHDLVRALRAEAKTEKIPFILLTGREESVAEDTMGLANAHLLKSVNLKDELIAVLSELVQPAMSHAQ
jgi:two-component system chemotaxis response regulator CheY